jgi:hypothetical protein
MKPAQIQPGLCYEIERGWEIWHATLVACCFLTAAIIYQAGRKYEKEGKNRGIFFFKL